MDIKGFKFSAVEAAIKKPGRLDLALIYSDVPATVAAVFTTNKVKAAPLLLSMERVKSGFTRAVVVNSGNANACGKQGMADATETARLIADSLNLSQDSILVASTGVIGQPLPMERMRNAIPNRDEKLSPSTLAEVSRALMTTDTFPKMEIRKGEAGAKQYTIAGVSKGSGMIMPNKATMLSFIVTDAAVEPFLLRELFPAAVDSSFNCITVDGDTSTNDTALIMANGMAENRKYARILRKLLSLRICCGISCSR
jgi:glutamate N-acetyltransferase/amino-acid N-acetyltransferase